MRIIIYEDASVIVDELQVDLTTGNNEVSFNAPGYVPGTLYIMTEHKYNIIETTNVSVTKGSNRYQGELISIDDMRVKLQSDQGVLTIDNYDTLTRESTEITLRISINDDNLDMNGIYYIPIIYTTDMISGEVRYAYDISSGILKGELLIRNEMNDTLTANIGIGATPLYPDLDTGNDVLEYSLIGENQLAAKSQTSIPLDIDQYSDSNGIYPLVSYVIDIEDEDPHLVLTLERKSANEVRPPYPGELLILSNTVPIARKKVERNSYIFDLGTIDSLSVESALDENGNQYVEIDNNEGADINIVLVYDDDTEDLPSVQILSPDGVEIPSTTERVNSEIQISFRTEGLGTYTAYIQ